MRESKSNLSGGFSLYEILVAVGILALVAVLAVPQVQKASFRSKVEVEKSNIVLIQEAKEAFAADNPGIELTNPSDLLAYLPNQQMPESPFGTEYKNLTDLSKPVVSGSSDVPATEENNFVAIAKSEASGYTPVDSGGVSSPIALLSVPTPTPTSPVVTLPPTMSVTPTPIVEPEPENKSPTVRLFASPSQTYRNSTVTLVASAQDPEGESLTYSFTSGRYNFPSQLQNMLSLQFPTLGKQSLSVMVTDPKGAFSTAASFVDIVNRAPYVELSNSVTSTFRKDPVTFVALGGDADNDTLSYQFSYGDEKYPASNSPEFSRSFSSLGTHSIAVDVDDGFGGKASAQSTVEITNRSPSLSFSASPLTTHRNSPVSFIASAEDPDGDPLKYIYWVDGRELPSTENPSLSKSFTTIGVKDVAVYVTDGFGGEIEKGVKVNITNRPPVVDFTGSPLSTTRKSMVNFFATASDPDKDPLSYTYYVDGQKMASSTNPFLSTNFTSVGKKDVSVVVEDGFRGLVKKDLTVNVTNVPPKVSLSSAVTSAVRGQEVTFTAIGSDMDKDLLFYRFKGMDWSVPSTNPVYKTSFSSVGSGQSTVVEVSDGFGGTAQATATINITNRPPVGSLDVNPKLGKRTEPFAFVGSATDPDKDNLEYRFRLGTNPWTQFSKNNVYSTMLGDAHPLEDQIVTMEVKDSLGAIAQAKASAKVINTAPTLSLSATPSVAFRGDNVVIAAKGFDAEGDQIRYRFKTNGIWGNFSTNNSITLEKVGTSVTFRTIEAEAIDAWNYLSTVASVSFTITNRPPSVSLSASPAVVDKGAKSVLTAKGVDPDGDLLTYQFRPLGTTTGEFTTNNIQTVTVDKDQIWEVIVRDSSRATASATARVGVTPNNAPKVTLSADKSKVGRNEPVLFTAVGTDLDNHSLMYRFKIEFGAWGSYGTQNTLTQKFNTQGIPAVYVQVRDSEGAESAVAETRVTVAHRAPTVKLGVTPTKGFKGDTFTYVVQGQDLDGDTLEYGWKVGSGPWGKYGSANSMTQVYKEAGEHSVMVRAIDPHGYGSTEVGARVTVENRIPVAKITSNVTSAPRGSQVTFTPSSSDPDKDLLVHRVRLKGKPSIPVAGLPTDGSWSAWGTTFSSPFKIPFADASPIILDYQVKESLSDVTSPVSSVSVQITNRLPSVTVTANIPRGPSSGSVFIGEPVVFTAYGKDPDHGGVGTLPDKLEFRYRGDEFVGTARNNGWSAWVPGKPAGGGDPNLKPGEYTFSLETKYTVKGVKTFEVEVRDQLGGVSSPAKASVTVLNRNPQVSLKPDRDYTTVGWPLTFRASGFDEDGQKLQYRFQDPANSSVWTPWGSDTFYVGNYKKRGPVTVNVEVRDSADAVASASTTIKVINQIPAVSLSVNPTTGVIGQVFTFTAAGGDKDGDSLTYSFNGGAFQGSNVYQTSYKTIGTQRVNVVAKDSYGDTSVPFAVSVNVINRNPVVTLNANPTSVARNTGATVTLTATGSDADSDPLSYQFTIPGEVRATSASNTTTTKANATTTYSVNVNDGKGGTSQASVTVTAVNTAPTVTLSANLTLVVRGQNVTFTATGADANGDLLTYRFRVGSGAWTAASATRTFATRFNTIGEQNVTVEVNDGQGGTAQSSLRLTVKNRVPSVKLDVNPKVAVRGEEVTFTAAGLDADGDSMVYSFNGGAYSSSKTFKTRYSTLGEQTVTVKAKDTQGGESQIDRAVVNIRNRKPTVSVAPRPSNAVREQSVDLVVSGSDPDSDALTYSINGGSFTNLEPLYITQAIPTQVRHYRMVGKNRVPINRTVYQYRKIPNGMGLSTKYNTLGSKFVTVVAKDAHGLLSNAERVNIQVVNRPPSVTLKPNTSKADTKEVVTFVAEGVDADSDNLRYRFLVEGKWTPWGREAQVTRSWGTTGSKSVSVEVSDSYDTETANAVVEVVLPEFVFYWNNGVNPNHTSQVLTNQANASQHNNFSAVMAAINSVGKGKIEAAIAAGGSTQKIVGSRTAETAESLVHSAGRVNGYSDGWVNHYSASWHSHAFSEKEQRKTRHGRGIYTQTRWRAVYYTYRNAYYHRHVYWHRTVTATKTVYDYQSRVMQANSIVGINAKTGEVVTIPAAQWAAVMAGNVKVGGQSVKVAGYAGMQSEAEEFLVRQYNQSRSYNELYDTTTEHYSTVTEHINTWRGSWGNWDAPWHPVTISFTKGGDFLSGEWRNLHNRKPVESAKRSFNLDGTGAKDWEWVGPTEGILVVNEAKDPMFQPNGTHFFGFDTWGKKWNNATEPMKTLDKNNDGFLVESELDTVWVWVDANTDAKVQEGELTTLPEKGITSISVNNQEDGKGGEWFPGGATGPAGTFDMVDWWSVR